MKHKADGDSTGVAKWIVLVILLLLSLAGCGALNLMIFTRERGKLDEINNTLIRQEAELEEHRELVRELKEELILVEGALSYISEAVSGLSALSTFFEEKESEEEYAPFLVDPSTLPDALTENPAVKRIPFLPTKEELLMSLSLLFMVTPLFVY